LQGDLPNPFAPPAGCRFHTRCPHVMPRCSTEAPALQTVAPGHVAACHLHADASVQPIHFHAAQRPFQEIAA
jgi:ABC-type dipeptide/oligopeptide/nickel transport system ATPase component